MNTTSNVTSPPLVPVSWQSVFWGLVPIAINSMSQPAGRICDAPSAIGPWMRVSPVICFIDMTLIIVRLFIYTFQISFRDACLKVMTQRYGYEVDQESSAFDDFRKNTIFRLAMFVLSISQIVKFYVVESLIWPKVWASMYLASFLVNEILAFISKPYIDAIDVQQELSELRNRFNRTSHPSADSGQPPEDPVLPHNSSSFSWPPGGPRPNDMPTDHGVFSWPYLSTAAGVVLNIYSAVKAISAVFQSYGLRFGQIPSTGLVILITGPTLFTVPSSFIAFRTEREKTNRIIIIGLIISTILIPIAYLSSSGSPGASGLEPNVTNIIVAIMVGVWVLITLAWASLIFSPIVDRNRDMARRFENTLAFYFFLFSVVATVLYYRFSFNSTGIYKPVWAENLG